MLSLRPSTWASIFGTILLLLLLLCGFVYNEALDGWYWRTQVGSALQKDLGFTAQTETRPGFSGTALVITSVVPGGEFGRAGIKQGDRPWDYHGREEITFFQRLEAARGSETTISLLRPGGSAGPTGDMVLEMRFTINVPAE